MVLFSYRITHTCIPVFLSFRRLRREHESKGFTFKATHHKIDSSFSTRRIADTCFLLLSVCRTTYTTEMKGFTFETTHTATKWCFSTQRSADTWPCSRSIFSTSQCRSMSLVCFLSDTNHVPVDSSSSIRRSPDTSLSSQAIWRLSHSRFIY